jgi:DNA invertase Pin-like site-specific DNA recombinase
VALYARVSTADQNAETQLTALRRYCEAKGWAVAAEYVDTVSGTVADRPRLSAMMEPASLRKVDAVLVWKFDRLFRSVQHMMTALDQFRTMGVDFVSVTECIDTTTPAGRFVYTLLAAVGEFEKDLIRERTRAGLARARAEGKRIGRPRVVLDAEEARRLWDGGNGLTYAEIGAKYRTSATKVCRTLRSSVAKPILGVSK